MQGFLEHIQHMISWLSVLMLGLLSGTFATHDCSLAKIILSGAYSNSFNADNHPYD